jgi:hypothetical protein
MGNVSLKSHRYFLINLSKRLCICLFILFIPAARSPFTHLQSSLNGGVEKNNSQLRLNLTNNSDLEFRGTARISLGSDSEQREIGRVALTLPPQETVLFNINSPSASGSHYNLSIYDQRSVLVFFKTAPIKLVSDPTPAVATTVTPVTKRSTPGSTAPVAAPNVIRTPPSPAGKAKSEGSGEVQVQARLIPGETQENDTDQFVIKFEISSPSSVDNGTFTITIGKFKESKPISINRQASIQFKLPDDIDTERIGYQLMNRSGGLLAKGEIDLGKMLEEDFISVSEIRTDKQSYDPGESAKVTVLLEGKSPGGYRIEVFAKEGEENVFFQDQKQISGNEETKPQEFTVSLPRNPTGPVVFEFKIYNSESGLLLDTGEREIPLKDGKPEIQTKEPKPARRPPF